MARLAPTCPVQASVRALKPFRACDRCGYSKDGSVIAQAVYQIDVTNGTLYLCGHDFKKLYDHIFAMGYEVTLL
jgi:hypothetical protein